MPSMLVPPTFRSISPSEAGKMRVVFDSTAKTGGLSLNKVLLSGLDLTNSLLGILVHFHQDSVSLLVQG